MPRNDLKAYTSITARIPQDLADQVKRYASEHRCGLSELIRDGLEMRLEADTPWQTPDRRHAPDAEVLQAVLHTLEAVLPTLRTQLQATVHETLPEVLQKVLQEVLQRETSQGAVSGVVLREVLPHADEDTPGLIAPARTRGHTEVLPQRADIPGPTVAGPTEVLPFDPAKYRLGRLCPRQHAYQGTGQSLRRNNKAGVCLACDAEQARARRAQKRPGQATSAPLD